jgi:hypothetical protein
MFHPHLLILAAHVFLHVTITSLHGKPQHIDAAFADMAACHMAADEIVASATLDLISTVCTRRYEA